MGAEQTAFGVKAKIGATAIEKVTGVGWDGAELEFADTTHHGLAARIRKQRPTLKKLGKATVKGLATKDNINQLQALVDAATAASAVTLEWPFTPAITCAFPAFVAKLQIEEAQVDGLIEFTAELEPEGGAEPTWTGLT